MTFNYMYYGTRIDYDNDIRSVIKNKNKNYTIYNNKIIILFWSRKLYLKKFHIIIYLKLSAYYDTTSFSIFVYPFSILFKSFFIFSLCYKGHHNLQIYIYILLVPLVRHICSFFLIH